MQHLRIAGTALVRVAVLALVAVLLVTACDQGRAALQFSPASAALRDAAVGQPYEQRIEISGNATPMGGIGVQDGTLPAGLAIERISGQNNAGRIFGTPTAAGSVSFTVYVWCYGTNVSGQTGTKAYTLTVK